VEGRRWTRWTRGAGDGAAPGPQPNGSPDWDWVNVLLEEHRRPIWATNDVGATALAEAAVARTAATTADEATAAAAAAAAAAVAAAAAARA
jgi:hypothetical protein